MVSSHSSTNDQKKFAQGMKVFGDIWMVKILHVLAQVTQRFNELQRNLSPVSPTVLADRLKKLEEYGLIVQERQTIDQLSVTYKLTDKGRTILPLLKSIEAFTKKYL
jgi:DNA-binding HxlR family transcriptional regulator